jgi:hypothetical protein
MAKKSMSLRDAFQHVKTIWPVVDPNPGFIVQLVAFEKMDFMCLSNYHEIVKQLSDDGEECRIAQGIL